MIRLSVKPPFATFRDRLKPQMLRCNGVIVVAGLIMSDTPYDEVYGRTFEGLKQLSSYTSAAKVRIGVENRCAEQKFLLSPREFNTLNDVGSSWVGVHLDVGNIHDINDWRAIRYAITKVRYDGWIVAEMEAKYRYAADQQIFDHFGGDAPIYDGRPVIDCHTRRTVLRSARLLLRSFKGGTAQERSH